MAAAAARVIVVDDDTAVLQMVGGALTRAGYDVTTMTDPRAVLDAVKSGDVDLVVSDIQMPQLSGLEMLRALKAAHADIEVIMLTGFGTIERAVEAVKLGAFDFLTKPIERLSDFALRAEKAIEHRMLKKRVQIAEAALANRKQFEGMIGQSAQMQAVFKLVESVSSSTSTVLIQGESGTGKELVARAIHDRSPRRDKPFVAVNCSALTDTLVESELFGHVKGAFTGALTPRKGLFEMADGGTIFLDEIGDIPAATQVRLLRVLQEGEIKRVGDTAAIEIDVRVIAATHVDLLKARAEGTFREDLYYRLNVIAVHLPPLRERPTDVPLLAQHFVRHYADKLGKKVREITPAAMEVLMRAPWVGNVRELENVMERAVVLTQDERVDVDDLPQLDGPAPSVEVKSDEGYALADLPFAQAKALTVAAFERRYLTTVMERNGNKVSVAALAAGMDRSNFRRLLKDNGLRGAKSPDENTES
jgi:two-component system response regulator HydG